jgi:predicted nucleic acid-binding protein
MKCVIDASVGFMWEVPELLSPKALKLRYDFPKNIHELLAPDLIPTEVGNALLVAERRKRILAGQASVFLADLLTSLPAIHSALPALLPRAIAIASNTVASVYDSMYVALAERES